jgi:hypothetical protein
LYNGWRHMFFIYPAMLIIATTGLNWFSKALASGFSSKFPSLVLNASVIISMLGTIAAMVVFHPYEGTYFTIFAGKNLKSARYRYGLDFYGLCAKEALDFVIEQSERQQIVILPSSIVVQRSAVLVPLNERSRIRWTGDFNLADYFIGIQLDSREPFNIPESFKPVYRVERQGIDLCVVYQTRDDH